jgi:predicted nucleic acid-binding protein
LVATHVVDSDWTIDYLKGIAAAVDRLNTLIDGRALATSIIVVGEVREGAIGQDASLARYDTMLEGVDVLEVDYEVAVTYAELRSGLRKSGMLMSDNDTWIAATALRHDLTLISRDKAFDRVPNLKLMR